MAENPGSVEGSSNHMRRLAVTMSVVAVLTTAACGDALEGVGDLSRRIVHGDETSTTSTTVAPGSPSLDLDGVTGAFWFNDGLDRGVDVLTRESLVANIWSKRDDQASAYVQASRREIAGALPGIEFPRLIPGSVTWISSQLVYDSQTATLDPTTAAAFGLWTVEPYTAPRNEAQVAVLRVGIDTLGTDVEGEIFSFRVSSGRELTWNDGGYVYQLFCRTGINEEACFTVARSTTSLALLATIPGPSTIPSEG